MKLLAGNPRAKAPRRNARRAPRPEGRCEPATFAWVEPLADVDPVVVERELSVDRYVDRPVIVETPVEVEKIVEKPVEVEKIIEVEKIVEKPVYVDRTVEVEKIVEKIVEKPVEVEKIVEVERVVEKPIIVEKEVLIEKPVNLEKPGAKAAEVAVVAAAATDVAADKKQKLSRAEKKAAKKSDAQPKAIIIGRGPTLATKIGNFMPKPLPVLAGAASLLLVLGGLALMSPSGDNASAEHGKTKAAAAAPAAATPEFTIGTAKERTTGKSRDPFASKGYTPPPTAATGDAAAKKEAAATRAAAPAAVAKPMYTAALTTYSSYTPWKKARKRAGGWIDFDNQPTVKVLSVGKASVLLFVVTDVEVIKEKSARISYNKPVRQVKMAKGGVVRFADYRDIQGDDVTYTIRYDGSDKIKITKK